MIKKIAILMVMIVSLSACGKQAEQTMAAGVEFKVDKLFTIEGCTVYRFSDVGAYRYFTNCSGSTSWDQQSGKTSKREGISGGAHRMGFELSPHEQQPEPMMAKSVDDIERWVL